MMQRALRKASLHVPEGASGSWQLSLGSRKKCFNKA